MQVKKILYDSHAREYYISLDQKFCIHLERDGDAFALTNLGEQLLPDQNIVLFSGGVLSGHSVCYDVFMLRTDDRGQVREGGIVSVDYSLSLNEGLFRIQHKYPFSALGFDMPAKIDAAQYKVTRLGTLMAKMEHEREKGKVLADDSSDHVFWTNGVERVFNHRKIKLSLPIRLRADASAEDNDWKVAVQKPIVSLKRMS